MKKSVQMNAAEDKTKLKKWSFTFTALVMAVFCSVNYSAAQTTAKLKASGSNSFQFSLTVNQPVRMTNSNIGLKTLSFPGIGGTGRAGQPVLPSKIYYVAVPPGSKVDAELTGEKKDTYNSVQPAISPRLILTADSNVIYKPSTIKLKYLETDRYPQSDIQLLGYSWIRNYYCAAIKINTAAFYWKTKEIQVLTSARLEVKYSVPGIFRRDNSPDGPFKDILKKIIINYPEANAFKAQRQSGSFVDTTGSWINYSSTYVKLKIPDDGIYRIGYGDLLDYGLDPSQIKPSTVKIFLKGSELPIFVNGEDDQVFGQNDYIEFWCTKNYGSPDYRKIVGEGEDYLNYMNRYSDTSIVWLTWGDGDGRRAEVQSGASAYSQDTLFSYLDKTHLEQDQRLWYYDAVVPRVQLPFWQENKVWTWQVLGTSGTLSVPFNIDNIVPDSQIKTYVRLISNGADVTANAHKTAVYLNSGPLQDTIEFNYKQTVNLNSVFPSSLAETGKNTLHIKDLPTSAAFQQILLDWVDVEYYRYNKAVNDSLLMLLPDSISRKFRAVKITGVTGPDSSLILYKIKPGFKRIENFTVKGQTLTFSDTTGAGNEYYLLDGTHLLKPVPVVKKKFADIRQNSKGADDIIITNRLLQSSVSAYDDLIKSSYGVRTSLVYTDDIFDEFSYGYTDPAAIKRFLEYAYFNWPKPSPAYLTLIGDANYDYKNLTYPAPAVRKKDLVPSYGDPVSDVWYSVWDSLSPDIPQMITGRIPASDNDEVNFYLNKYRTYLSRPYDIWNKTFLFFSGGDPSQSGQLNELHGENSYIMNSYAKAPPLGGLAYDFYKTTSPSTNFGPYTEAYVQNAINEGGVFISYLGHSGTQTWDNGITDVTDLKNSYNNRFPMITDFGCSTGKFAEPDISAFGELFLTGSPEGQAISYLGNTSWGYLSTSTVYPGYFYQNVLRDSVLSIGEAHLLAKIELLQNTGYGDAARVFDYCNLMFGDPMLKIALPQKPNLRIEGNDIKLLTAVPSAEDDSAYLSVAIHNLGAVTNDSVNLLIRDKVNGITEFRKSLYIKMPLLADTLSESIPVKNEPGEHDVTVQIDSADNINEIYKNDNTASITFNVYSNLYRTLQGDRYYAAYEGRIRFLNPSSSSAGGGLIFSYDTSTSFFSPLQMQVSQGIFYTDAAPKDLISGKRYWWRVKSQGSAQWSPVFSFKNTGDDYNWYIDAPIDSVSGIDSINAGFNSTENAWQLVRTVNNLKIISGGFDDGSFASMRYNLKETMPNTYFWGISTALIDTATFRPYGFKYFVYPASTSSDSLIGYLNSLPNGTVIAMTVCDDGAQSVLGFSLTTKVRKVIEGFGSIYADSVKYRESWCMIGRKGSPRGSALESYKKIFEGPAVIDTSISTVSDSGSIVFPQIGPAAAWDSTDIKYSLPAGSEVTVRPIGINSSGSADTLSAFNLTGGKAALSGVKADVYPKMKLLLKLYANARHESPQIYSAAVKYEPPAELGTNYQTAGISADTIGAGGTEKINFFVYNAGGSPADSFKVAVDLGTPDNSRTQIFSSLVDSINPGSRQEFSAVYTNEGLSGAYSFFITIDPDNKVREIYKDNNFYSIPFYVKADTSRPLINITFNGRDIINGDYISADPKILITYDDKSLLSLSDTSAVNLFLNGKRISYLNNQSLQYEFTSGHPKMKITYMPKLSDGDYTLKAAGANLQGGAGDTSAVSRSFTVSNEAKLLEVYNYPDPFPNGTYFTMKLPQIPDELKIKIFTVAGRLVREIVRNSAQLNYDFNRIYWDGRDQDGDKLANGVYLYKVILKKGSKTDAVINKLAIIR